MDCPVPSARSNVVVVADYALEESTESYVERPATIHFYRPIAKHQPRLSESSMV